MLRQEEGAGECRGGLGGGKVKGGTGGGCFRGTLTSISIQALGELTCSPSSSQLRLPRSRRGDEREKERRATRTEGERRCCSMLFSGIINVTRHVNAR